jgi:dTDP-4-dehydrorhamnose reductase
MQVIILGASGMLGAMVTDVLAKDNNFRITATVRSPELRGQGVNRYPSVNWQLFDAAAPDLSSLGQPDRENIWIVNAIGITKPLVRDDNAFEVERAIRINALFPYQLAEQAEAMGARVIQIATDCVYSGSRGQYDETDTHDALDVYGKTKSLGEVRRNGIHHLRCSIIGPEPKEYKFFAEWLKRQPRQAQVNGFINHQWNGVTTLQYAKIVKGIVQNHLQLNHLQHIVPGDEMSKADMLKALAQAFRREDILIKETEAAQVIDRTLRTRKPERNQSLWQAAGYDYPPTVSEMITEMTDYQVQWCPHDMASKKKSGE